MWFVRDVLGCEQRISAKSAVQIAEAYALSRNWPWDLPVAVNRNAGHWLVRTNLPTVKKIGGASVELYVHCDSGTVSGPGLANRPAKEDAQHFSTTLQEVFPKYLNDSESSPKSLMDRLKKYVFFQVRVTAEQARVIAENACQEQGWPVLQRVVVERHGRTWKFFTNFPNRGGNVQLLIDCQTGEILSGGFVKY